MLLRHNRCDYTMIIIIIIHWFCDAPFTAKRRHWMLQCYLEAFSVESKSVRKIRGYFLHGTCNSSFRWTGYFVSPNLRDHHKIKLQTRLTFSQKRTTRKCVYIVTTAWLWPWPRDLDTRPWPRCSCVLRTKNEVSKSKLEVCSFSRSEDIWWGVKF